LKHCEDFLPVLHHNAAYSVSKVLDNGGEGDTSSAILALEYLRELNEKSPEIKVDGVNMSLGYPFKPDLVRLRS